MNRRNNIIGNPVYGHFVFNNHPTIDLNGKPISIDFDLNMSQLDGKLRKILSGCGGGFCLLCLISDNGANDITIIRNGFELDRDIDVMNILYEMFGDELVRIKSADRDGITGQPMISGNDIRVLKNIPTLHAYINSLRYMEDLAFHLNARNAFVDEQPIRGAGKRKSDEQKLAVDIAESEFKFQAKNGRLNLILNTPDPCGAGGKHALKARRSGSDVMPGAGQGSRWPMNSTPTDCVGGLGCAVGRM